MNSQSNFTRRGLLGGGLTLLGSTLHAQQAGQAPGSIPTVRYRSGFERAEARMGLESVAPAAAVEKYLVTVPHLAVSPIGEIPFWETRLVFRNETSVAADLDVYFFGDDGGPLSLSIDGQSVTNYHATIGPLSTIEIKPAPPAKATGMAAALVYDGVSIKGQGLFRKTATGLVQEAAAPFASDVADCIIPLPSNTTNRTVLFDGTGIYRTGWGFFNPNSTAVTMTVDAFDSNGLQLDTYTQQLPGFGHSAWMIDDRMPKTKGKKGLLRITGDVRTIGFLNFGPDSFATFMP